MTAETRRPKPKTVARLTAEVEQVLAQSLDDAPLRTRLEELAAERAFAGLTCL